MTPCLDWKGGKNSWGYGHIWDKEKKKQVRAHRYYYEKLVGPIPKGMLVCHKCDNRACINPEHLFLGTHKDNTQDAVKKGRIKFPLIILKGEQSNSAKLSQKQVDEIRAEYSPRLVTKQQLAQKFGVSLGTVYNIAHSKYLGTRKLTQEQINEIRVNCPPHKVTCRSLAEKFGVAESTINRIVLGKYWK
jgi:DNA-binding XRE family transcriptional regulator